MSGPTRSSNNSAAEAVSCLPCRAVAHCTHQRVRRSLLGALQTIVAVSLPAIQRDLGFSQSGLAWVTSAYLVAFGGLLLLFGGLGDILGRRRVFLAGLTVFTVASAQCDDEVVPGGSCRVLVRFAPAQPNVTSSARLVLSTNTADREHTVGLSATSIATPTGEPGQDGEPGEPGAAGGGNASAANRIVNAIPAVAAAPAGPLSPVDLAPITGAAQLRLA